MTTTVREKAKKLGGLLAASPIAHDLKMAILENLAKMTERHIDALVVCLENEAKGIEILIKEADDFAEAQDADWDKVAEEQVDLAAKIVSEEVRQLEKEDQISALRQNIINQTEGPSA
ncbi:MAG TPA: hypothetical protein PKN73_01115 [Candidatus Paceibacterota bacterium]|jgi:hypothetical protein|nr:hypothetical protein [Candidatus Paceibacterota bacterium]HOH11250.1 hypothetical protein [Candidatus Paceibacterota bacterium]HOY11162.1 hypothetical protein [Candidatus Paceibacterota bacterium]HPB60676.1 hypothetical protein [Candidatus Paceibacterota bacterium]HPI24594.1 hypothetical protein [Candidatus Paceibacterota bacterium]